MSSGLTARARWLVMVLLAGVALALPATAWAANSPSYKVLVVQGTDAGLNAAGVAAIRSAAKSAGFTVVAPGRADVADQFTAKKLDDYRAVVFLDTGAASGAHRRPAGRIRALLPRGGGFVGIGSAIETDPSWQFLTDVLGTRSSGTADVAVRDGQGRRPRPRRHARTCPSTGTARTSGTTSRRTSAASRTCSPPSSRIRSARSRRATRWTASPAARWAPTTRSRGARTTRAAARSTAASATPPRASDAGLRHAPQGRDQLGRRRGRPGQQRLRRDRARELPAGQGQRHRRTSSEPIGFDQLPGRPHHPDLAPRQPCACTTRRPARRS